MHSQRLAKTMNVADKTRGGALKHGRKWALCACVGFGFLFFFLRYNNGGRRTVSPKPNDGHGKAQGSKTSLGGIATRQTLDVNADVLAVGHLVHVLLAGGLAVHVAEDLVAGLHLCAGGGGGGAAARLLGRSEGGRGRGGAEEARGGVAQGCEQRGVEQVGVAGVSRGEGEGEGKGGDGEGGEGEQRRLQ